EGQQTRSERADHPARNGKGVSATPATSVDGPTSVRPEKGRNSQRPPPPPAKGASVTPPVDLPGEGSLPSIPPVPAAGPWPSYKEMVAQVAQRIVDAQRPIRVLHSIRWDKSVEEQFRKNRYREMPKVDRAWYESCELGFDPKKKAEEFEEIAQDIDRELG